MDGEFHMSRALQDTRRMRGALHPGGYEAPGPRPGPDCFGNPHPLAEDLAEQVFDGFNHCSGKSFPELEEHLRSMSPGDAVIIEELEVTLLCGDFGWTYLSIPRDWIIWGEQVGDFWKVA